MKACYSKNQDSNSYTGEVQGFLGLRVRSLEDTARTFGGGVWSTS